MGAKTRFNYSAVGDAVNVAARLESCCKDVGFDILISDSTARMQSGAALLEAGAVPLKGKSSRMRSLWWSAIRRSLPPRNSVPCISSMRT